MSAAAKGVVCEDDGTMFIARGGSLVTETLGHFGHLFEVIFLFLSLFYKKISKQFKLIIYDIFFVFECKMFTIISNSI